MTFYSVLTQGQVEEIHGGAMRVLEEVGVKVESEGLLRTLADFGGRVDLGEERVRFPASWVEQFIADSEKYDWGRHQPSFGAFAGIYACQHLDPESEDLEPFTESSFRDYALLARGLEEVGGASALGVPFLPAGIPAEYGALSEKLYGWKYGAEPSGTVQFAGLCPYLVEMFERRAEEMGRGLEEVFAASGFMISPLRLARPECEQLLYFRSRGLRMSIGRLASLGGSAPVTVAGAAVLAAAEGLFLNILRRALWGDRGLHLGGGTMVMDMLTLASLYGRPEQVMVSTVMGQMARRYGARSWGHGGLTDAREPSAEAGMQKAFSAAVGVCSCGSAAVDAGLLAVDEVCSPEQMVYDAELVSAVRRMLRPVEVSEETTAVADIREVGPGGSFMGTDLTAARFREEVWQPKMWAREGLAGWRRAGARRDRERAKERVREVLAATPEGPWLSEECERDLRRIIARAVEAGAAKRRAG